MIKNVILLITFLGIGTTVAFSQDTEPDSITWSLDIDNVVITAQYAPTHSKNAVHRVRTIKQEDIQQRGVSNLEELLQQELNIRISQDMILGSSINLQGISGQNVQIMIDGVPVIGRVGDDIDLGQINLHNIERVEIVEGPMSVNYGTNALGGVINLITKKSQLHRYDTQLELKTESIGRYNVSAGLGFRPVKKLLLRVQGRYSDFKGFDSVPDTLETDFRSFQWNPKKQISAGGSARYDFAEDFNVRYATNWFKEDVSNLGEMRRPQFQPYAFDDYYHTNRHEHSLHQEGTLGKYFYLKTTMGYNFFKRQKNTYRFEFDTGEETEVANEQDTTVFNAIVLRPVFASKFPNGKIDFQVGLDFNYENAYGQRINDETSDKENFSELGDYAVFGSLKYQPFDKFIIQAGARISYNTRFDAPVVPSLNIRYALAQHWTLRASYAKGFRAPSLKELFFYFVDTNHFILGNTDLKAETSNNFQVNMDWDKTLQRHNFKASLMGFYNDIQQKIDLYQYVEVDGKLVPAAEVGQVSNQYAYFNQSRYKTLGGSLQFSYNHKNLNLQIGGSPIGRYNLLSETFAEVNPFTFVFETSAEMRYKIPKYQWQFSLYVRNNDKLVTYFQDYDAEDNPITGELIQDGFTIADFTVSKYLWKKRIHLVGGVQNIFDIRNVPLTGGGGGAHSGGGGSVPFGTGRIYMLKCSWNFGWNNL